MKRLFAFLLLAVLSTLQFAMAQTTSLKIKALDNKPIVEARVNGKLAYFLIDTGSDITVIHQPREKYYDFKIKRLSRTHSVIGIHGRGKSVYRAYALDLQLGDLPIKTSFFSYDIGAIVSSIFRKNYVKISGIIGSDVLLKYGFVIDYQAERIYFGQETPVELNAELGSQKREYIPAHVLSGRDELLKPL